MTHYPETHWAFEDPDAAGTQVLPSADAHGANEPTTIVPTPDAQHTRVDPPPPPPTAVYPPVIVRPVGVPPAAASAPVPSPPLVRAPAGPPGLASERADGRYADIWAFQMARMNNRASTDVGLLILRLAFLPLVLHGVHAYLTYDDIVAAFGPFGSVTSVALAVGLMAVWFLAPVAIATGFGTRLAGGLVTAGTVLWYLTMVGSSGSWLNPATGTLAAEIWLAYGVGGAVLFFTGGGRFSLDHIMTSDRRDRVADKRVNRQLGA